MSAAEADNWESLLRHETLLSRALRSTTSTHVTSRGVRDEAREIAQLFFRRVRPELAALGISDSELSGIDRVLQDLNLLAQSPNRRTTYIKLAKEFRTELNRITSVRDKLIGIANGPKRSGDLSNLQLEICETLEKLIPSAALSFRQAIIDLNQPERLSFRGAAVELRETLREVVDHFAPDTDVKKSPGFQLEKGRDKPTMRQKVQFILKSRNQGETVTASSKDAAVQIDAGPDKLARSIYNRGSAATHISNSRQEAKNLLRYTEALLAELLQV